MLDKFKPKEQYYCLVAGLSELSFDSSAAIDVLSLREEIREGVGESDLPALDLLYTYYDIVNLVNAIKGNNMPFNELGTLTADEIAAEIDAPEVDELPFVSKLPTAVAEIVAIYKGRVEQEDEPQTVAEEQLENQLWLHYYSVAEQSSCRFLRQWSATDRAIRNIIAAAKARQMGFSLDNVTVGTGEIVDQIKSSAAADFGLKGEFEYSEALWSVLQTDDFVERERRMDALRWNIAQELTDQDFFNIDFLAAYLVKTNLIHRWRALDKQIGKQRFNEIVASFTADVKL